MASAAGGPFSARARWAVSRAVGAPGVADAPPELPASGTGPLGGVFVTLRRRDGRLRGCIGAIRMDRPLPEMLDHAARSAAIGDPRFKPVEPGELADLLIEVSLLHPFRPIRPEEIEIGKHGLIIHHRGRSGLLLPQVAAEYGWSREHFLDELCRKAGLPVGSWRSPDAELLGFEADIQAEASTA